jgi:DNA-binding IclR family transcriptional regulator
MLGLADQLTDGPKSAAELAGPVRAHAPSLHRLMRTLASLGILAEQKESGTYKPKTEAWDELAITDYELHRRIREEQRHRREHRLWIVAVISAVIAFLSAAIAFLSAVAAWLAVPNTPQ